MMERYVTNGERISEESSLEVKNTMNSLAELLKQANMYISDYNFRDCRKGK